MARGTELETRLPQPAGFPPNNSLCCQCQGDISRNLISKYDYVTYEDVNEVLFPSFSRAASGEELQGLLCWVLTSKGRRKRHTRKQRGQRPCQSPTETTPPPLIEESDEKEKHAGSDAKHNGLEGECSSNSKGGPGIRTELFARARIINTPSTAQADGDRITVQYSKGATYGVRRRNLLPVFEPSESTKSRGIIIAVAETCDYRRCLSVHVCPPYDSVLEIGCDLGLATDRVRRVMEEYPMPAPLPKRSTTSEDNSQSYGSQEQEPCKTGVVAVMGVDKCALSIKTATERFPRTHFSQIDCALTEHGWEQVRRICRGLPFKLNVNTEDSAKQKDESEELDQCQEPAKEAPPAAKEKQANTNIPPRLLHGYPTVVAIDINGSRELPAVMQCLEMVMKQPIQNATAKSLCPKCGKAGQENRGEEAWEEWNLPRLIVVKSRTLHHLLCHGAKADSISQA